MSDPYSTQQNYPYVYPQSLAPQQQQPPQTTIPQFSFSQASNYPYYPPAPQPQPTEEPVTEFVSQPTTTTTTSTEATTELRQRHTNRAVIPASSADDRAKKLIRAATEKLPPSLAKYGQTIEQAADKLFTLIAIGLPFIVQAYSKGYALYSKLPLHTPEMIYGGAVMLFGGHFAATMAVAEAFKQSGAGAKLWACILDLYEAFNKVKEASDEDDTVDDNNDGIPDVDQITPAQLLMRKTTLALRSVDPKKFNKALHGLYQGFIAAVMVVQFKFAKTIALGNSLGDVILRTVKSSCGSMIDRYVQPEYRGWAELVLSYTCKSVGISVAWTLQFFQSVLQSAINGSRIFSHALLAYLKENKIIDVKMQQAALSVATPAAAAATTPAEPSFDATQVAATAAAITVDTEQPQEARRLEEMVAWILAFFGLLFQYKLGFHIPFPFNIILIPLSITEWSLRWFAAAMTFKR